MSQSKPRIRLFLSILAVVSMIGGSFVVVANAAPGKGKGGSRPGPKPSPSARPEKPAKPERPERPEKPERPIQTRLGFRLDTRHIEEGGSVTGMAKLGERVGKGFAPFAGQTLHVYVDRTEQDAVTTGSDGTAVITATGDVGGHVVSVVYAGDATHRPAKRSQGFHVGSATAEDGGCPPPPSEDDGGDEVQAFGPGRGGPGKGGPGREDKPQKPCRGHDDHKGEKEDPAREEEDDEEDDDDKDDADDESTDDSLDTTTDGVDSEEEEDDD